MRFIQHLPASLALILLPAALLAADATPPATGNSTKPLPDAQVAPAPGTDDEVITLEEFTVSAQSMKDAYIVSEATTGTRLGGEIVDLPYSVQVLTEEFVQDFLLDDNDLMSFVAGATVTGGFDGDGSSITIRGFSSMSLRDGFRFLTAMKSPMTTERTEVMKGPASILYGRTTPGGIVNSVAKKPKTKTLYSLEGYYSKYGNYRLGASATGPIINNNLYYFISAEYFNPESPIDFVSQHTTQLHGSLLYKPTKNSSITITGDYKPTRGSVSPGSGPGTYYYRGGTLALDDRGQPNPYANVVGADAAIRGWNIFPYFNIQGPDTYNNIDRYSLHLLYEQRINRNTSFRLGALDYYAKGDLKYWGGGNYYFEARDGILGNATALRQPYLGHDSDRYYATQAELVTKFTTGPITHKLLFLGDYSYWKEVYQRSNLPDASNVLRPSVQYININNPDWGLDTDWSLIDNDWNRKRDPNDPSDDLYRDRHRYDKSYGLTASWAGSMLDSRLLFMASARYDDVSVHQTEPDIKPRDNAYGDFSDISYSLCLVWKIVPKTLQLYVNHSTSYNDNPGTLSIDTTTGNFTEPTSSVGYELGLKGVDLLNKRLSYTLSIAQIEQNNVKVDNPAYGEPGAVQYLGSGSNRARAIELSTTWILTPQLTLLLGGAYTDSKVLSATMPWIIGGPVKGSSKWDANIVLRYNFPRTSPLKGLRLGIAASYRSDFISCYANYTNYKNNPDTSTWVRQYYQGEVDSFILCNAFAAYKWANGPKNRYQSSLQLNCSNVLDKTFITYTGRYYNYGRSFALTYRLNF